MLLRNALRDAPPEGYPAGPTMQCRVLVMEPGVVQLGHAVLGRIGCTVDDIKEMYNNALMTQVGAMALPACMQCTGVSAGERGHTLLYCFVQA